MKKKTFTYILGYIFGLICFVCGNAILIGSTIKYLKWLF